MTFKSNWKVGLLNFEMTREIQRGLTQWAPLFGRNPLFSYGTEFLKFVQDIIRNKNNNNNTQRHLASNQAKLCIWSTELYAYSSILALMPLKFELCKVQSL
jgi:hypothetical protein